MEKDSLLLLFAVFTFLSSIFGIVGTYGSILEFSNFMTGHPIEEGVINLSVMEVLSLNFTNGVIDFGPGNVTVGISTGALIDTLGGVANGSWSPTTEKFRITNIGNTNLTLNLSSGKTADEFIGGGSKVLPSYKFNLTSSDGTADGCKGVTHGVFQDFPIAEGSPSPIQICSIFSVGENITIDLQLRIPEDSKTGLLEDSISITYEEHLP